MREYPSDVSVSKNCYDAKQETDERRDPDNFPPFPPHEWCTWTIPQVAFKRNIRSAPQAAKETVNKTFVQPTVECATTSWAPSTESDNHKIEMVQRRAARSGTKLLQSLSIDDRSHSSIAPLCLKINAVVTTIFILLKNRAAHLLRECPTH